MPNVGILNLQINDNSEKAVSGLNHLADALTRVRQAIGSGLKLNGVASGVEKLAKAVKTNMTDDMIDRIGRLTTELSKLQGLGNINIKISGASIESIREAVESTRESIGTINTGFEEIEGAATRAGNGVDSFNQRMRETQSLVQNMGWTGGVNQFQQMFEAWDRLRSSMALGPGQATGGSAGPETGWTVWKNGAIEVEGTVSDVSEHIAGYLNEPIQYLTGIGSQLVDIREYITNADEEMLRFARDTSAMSSGENAIIPYGGENSGVQHGLEQIAESAGTASEGIAEVWRQWNIMREKYAAFPERTLEDYFYGMRWGKTDTEGVIGKSYHKDVISESLQGHGTANDYQNALNAVAQNLKMSVEDVRARVEELRAALSQPIQNNVAESLNSVDTSGVTEATAQAATMRDEVAQETQEVASGNAQLNERTGIIRNLISKVSELKNRIRESTESTGGLSGAFDSLKDKIKNLGINKLAGQFARLVKYRMLRAVIKQIADGFREGVQNVYEYSNAIGSSFAPAMDSAVSALSQMKNSIGAAAAPLIQSLIPILQTVVNWVITAVNYLNQFIALMRGQATWTKAVPQTEKAFEGQTKAAKGASAAIKDLLADWDELNIIQSEAGGGGGGGSGVDGDAYKSMFEEIGVFDSKIKSMTDSLKDNLDDVKRIAEGIGVALLAWKLSKAFTGTLGSVMKVMAAAAIIDTSWRITTILNDEYVKTKDEGYLIKDLAQTLVGGAAAGLIVWKATDGIWNGLLTVGLDLSVSAGTTYAVGLVDADGDARKALYTLSGVKLALGTIATGLGFGLMTGSVAAGIGGAALAPVMFALSALYSVSAKLNEKADEIARKAFAATGEGGVSVSDIFDALQAELDKATSGYSLVIKAFEGASQLKTDMNDLLEGVQGLSGLIKTGGGLTQEEADSFKKIWGTIFESFEGLTAKSFETVFAGLNNSLALENEKIRNQAKELRVSLLVMQENISEAMAEFKLEQENLADKISRGTATQEEIDTYFKNLEIIAKKSMKTTDALDEVISGGQNIDFGDEQTGLDNAVQFMNDVSAAAQAATDEITAGYNTEMEALANLQDQVDLLRERGLIGDEQYEQYKEIFEQTAQNFKAAADEEKQKVKETVQAAYQQVINQAMEAALNETGTDGTSIFLPGGDMLPVLDLQPLNKLIVPVLTAAKEAGYEASDEFWKTYRIGIGDGDWFGEGGEDSWYGKYREAMKAFYNANDGDNKINNFPYGLTPEISILQMLEEGYEGVANGANDAAEAINGLKDGDPFKNMFLWNMSGGEFISPDAVDTEAVAEAAETVSKEVERVLDDEDYSITLTVEPDFKLPDPDDDDMHIWDQTGEYIDALAERLFDATSLEEQRNAVAEALKSAGGLEDIYDIADTLIEMGYDFNLFKDLFPDIAVNGMLQNTNLMASGVEDMASRIRTAMASIDGISWTMDVPGGTPVFGGFHVVIPQIGMAATGGFVRSGDLIMANENGNIEMMGNMGGKSVVANNQQIVDGISHGVTNANENVVSELRSLTVLMQRMLNKEFVARAVPSSAWGRSNEQSADAFGRVTG